MGIKSDYKKIDDMVAWDLDKGCRRIVNQSTKSNRRLKKRLMRIARKRLKDACANTDFDVDV